MNSDRDPVPTNFLAFSGHDCFTLEQLNQTANWSAVEHAVYPDEHEHRPSAVATGILSPCRRLSLRRNELSSLLY